MLEEGTATGEVVRMFSIHKSSLYFTLRPALPAGDNPASCVYSASAGIYCFARASTPIGGWGVDVGAWLRGLGLGQYEQAFRDNDIDDGRPARADRRRPRRSRDHVGRPPAQAARRHRRPARRPAPAAAPSPAGPIPDAPPAAPSSPGRAAAAHGDVRRPGRLHRALARRLDPRRCARSCAPTRTRSRARSRASTATSPS